MSSQDEQIEPDDYIDTLPTFQDKGDGFNVEMRGWLKLEVTRKALALLEEKALSAEKTFVQINFMSEEGRLQAVKLQGIINALRDVPSMLIDAANEESKTND